MSADVLLINVSDFKLGSGQCGTSKTRLDINQAIEFFGWFDRSNATPSYAGWTRFQLLGEWSRLNGRAAPPAPNGGIWETLVLKMVKLHQ